MLWGRNEELKIEEIEVLPPRAHEVRVKIIASGVCHSDQFAIEGVGVAGFYPVILGHEGAGIVESVGPSVTKFKAGDHVIPLFVPQCRECEPCRHPDANICIEMGGNQTKGLMADGSTRFRCKGQAVRHFAGTSTFAEYSVIADISLTKIDERAPLNKVCLIGCGVSTGYGSAMNTVKNRPGTSCAVWGLGGVGLATVMGCKKAGASRIIGVDVNPAKFELAKQFGCTEFVNPKDYPDRSVHEVLIEKTGGGLDYTFECVGNVNTIRQAFDSTHVAWGTGVLVGLCPADITINGFTLLFGRTFKGMMFGGWKSADSVPKLVAEYMNKDSGLLLDEFITHTMGLDKINEAFTLMREGKSIRSVIEF